MLVLVNHKLKRAPFSDKDWVLLEPCKRNTFFLEKNLFHVPETFGEVLISCGFHNFKHLLEQVISTDWHIHMGQNFMLSVCIYIAQNETCSQQICLAGPTLIAAVPTETSPGTRLNTSFHLIKLLICILYKVSAHGWFKEAVLSLGDGYMIFYRAW